MSLFYWGAQHSRWVPPRLGRWERPPPLSCYQYLIKCSPLGCWPSLSQGHTDGTWSACSSPGPPRSFFPEMLSSRLVLILCKYGGLFFPSGSYFRHSSNFVLSANLLKVHSTIFQVINEEVTLEWMQYWHPRTQLATILQLELILMITMFWSGKFSEFPVQLPVHLSILYLSMWMLQEVVLDSIEDQLLPTEQGARNWMW